MKYKKYDEYIGKQLRSILLLLLCSYLLIFSSCKSKPTENTSPNILWIYLEDTSPLLGCYGTSIISTPNIDKLAKAGTLYSNAIMPAPVCSASRSSSSPRATSAACIRSTCRTSARTTRRRATSLRSAPRRSDRTTARWWRS